MVNTGVAPSPNNGDSFLNPRSAVDPRELIPVVRDLSDFAARAKEQPISTSNTAKRVDSLLRFDLEDRSEYFEGLRSFTGTCNSYVLDSGEGLVVIDPGDSLSARHLARALKDDGRPVKAVIGTHGYGKAVEGIPILIDALTETSQWDPEVSKILTSSVTKALIENPHARLESWLPDRSKAVKQGDIPQSVNSKSLETRPHYSTDHVAPHLPDERVLVDIGMDHGDEIQLGALKLRCIRTPGGSDGAISLLAEREGESKIIAFTGSLVRVDRDRGVAPSLGALQREYASFQLGIARSEEALRNLSQEDFHVLAPSSGEISPHAQRVLADYGERVGKLKGFATGLPSFGRSKNGEVIVEITEGKVGLQPIVGLPYLQGTTFATTEANTYLLDGVLLLDWTARFDDIDKRAGEMSGVKTALSKVERLLTSHAHDDHVMDTPNLLEDIPALKVEASELLAPVLRHPERTHQLCRADVGIGEVREVLTPKTLDVSGFEELQTEGVTLRYAMVPVSGHTRSLNLIFVEREEESTGKKTRFCHVGDCFAFGGTNEGTDLPDWIRYSANHQFVDSEGRNMFFTFPVPMSGADYDSFSRIASLMEDFAPTDESVDYYLLSGHAKPVTNLLQKIPTERGTGAETVLTCMKDHLTRLDRIFTQLTGGDAHSDGFALDGLDCEIQPGERKLTQEERTARAIDIAVRLSKPNGFKGKDFDGMGWFTSGGKILEGSLVPVTFSEEERNVTFRMKIPLTEEMLVTGEMFALQFNIASNEEGRPIRLADVARVQPG